jgi:beta-galactosidase/beta-glucuronidase
MLDPHDAGEWQELHAPVLTGGNWQPIKTFSASWSDQGLNYYKGIAWYKAAVDVPGRFAGRKIRLWLAAIDEAAKVWVNGKLITYEAEKREKDGSVTKEVRDTLSGSWRPLEVEVTNAIEFGKPNTFVLKLINQNLDELGTGGIMKVVMLYAPKPE